MTNKNKYKSNKLDIASIKSDISLQKLEAIIENLLNIAIIINLFQSHLIFDNKPQVKGDIQKPQEIIIKDLRQINTIIKFIRKK